MINLSNHSSFSMSNPIVKNPSWWHRRTSLEKYLMLVLGTLLTSTFIFIFCVSTSMYKQHHSEYMPTYSRLNLNNNDLIGGSKVNQITNGDNKPKICFTEGCVHTASNLLKNMDLNVDPCDDFYRFSCGKFLKETQIPDDKTAQTAFSVISDALEEQLRTIVEEPIRENEPKPFKLVKNLYKACMNVKNIEILGLEPMKRMLQDLGGWPVLEGQNWNEETFSWKDSVYKFHENGYSVDYFIDFSIVINVKNNSERIIDLDQATLGLSREYLVKGINEKLVNAYYRYMIDIAVLLGADKDVATEELKESLEFEIKLANISLPLEQRRNATKLYNPMSLDELQTKFPSIPWVEYLNTLLYPKDRLRETDIVVVDVPNYISKLEELLQTTPKKVQANYALWRATAASVSYLTEAIRNRQLQYSTALSGRTQMEPRWKECVDTVSSSISLAMGALYVRKFFKEDAKANAIEMVELIREEMNKILNTVEWMDNKTRRKALEKAKAMTAHIAYPDELLDDNKISEFYDKLEIDPNNYYKSILNLTKFGTGYSFSLLRKPVNKTEWISHGHPALVNAFYSSIENSITFPAGILQGSFFSNDRPKYMNFGAIGFVIGHEITHGFDDQGRQFDKNGNLVDWWQEDTKRSYIEKARCIIEQYGNYSVPEVNLTLNGVNNQGENIADNGGMKEAYNAYVNWAATHPAEPRLPGLQNFTPQQMFWISAASTWCSKHRPETLKLRITTGFHSPGEFRVLGPVSNLESFSRDFQCPSGSRMNPVHKCKVW
ncbi:neprilysin-2-like [Diaphorina citri]|uniref:Neprilysin-2-like n=1 Tax=Diaphorina citri TaxID=121845 RepID=A0A3Q0J997_DIACI|nr:neprilysin-2-like [Diaphorina citri]XP_026683286.1 neprilysin-2-like [Diaphorina citri]XP_026683287.1 neprilysin-2-like [Diaphorina citri]XP_026683288.1 neprilysin-2-like [Diaphorina citri]